MPASSGKGGLYALDQPCPEAVGHCPGEGEGHNARLSGYTALFPFEVLEKAVEKSSQVFHNEAIRKAVLQMSLSKSLGS